MARVRDQATGTGMGEGAGSSASASASAPAARRRRARDASRITLRQLCRLGLPGPLLLPTLLPAVRQLVPASHAGFFFCDERGSILNLYAERLLAPNDMAAYHDRHNDQQFRRQYLARVAAASPVSRRSVGPEERASPYHREVLAPLGIEHFLYAIVRHGQRPIGQLSLYRGPDEPPFDEHDAAQLADVLHYLGEALAVPAVNLLRDVQAQTLEEAIAVLTPDGQELFADAGWHRLIRMAHGNAIAPAAALHERETLPRFLRAVMAAVETAPQAIHQVHTHWGRFAFRRHDLQARPDGAPAVALVLSRLAAEPLRLAQGAAVLGLSPQQREVALLMALGRSNADIAAQMGLSLNTASYHAKQVLSRLGVHERSAVARTLHEAAAHQDGRGSYPPG